MISMPKPSKRLLPVNSKDESFSIPYGGFCKRLVFGVHFIGVDVRVEIFAYNSREHDEGAIEKGLVIDAAQCWMHKFHHWDAVVRTPCADRHRSMRCQCMDLYLELCASTVGVEFYRPSHTFHTCLRNQWKFVFGTRSELWASLTVLMKFEMLRPFSHIVPFSHTISPGWICSNPNCLNVSASKITPSWRSPLCNRIAAGSNSMRTHIRWKCLATIFHIQIRPYFPRPRLPVR